MLRFTKEEAEVRKSAPPFVPALYIRTFDVSEVNCVLPRRTRSFKIIALYQFDIRSEVFELYQGKLLIKR